MPDAGSLICDVLKRYVRLTVNCRASGILYRFFIVPRRVTNDYDQ